MRLRTLIIITIAIFYSASLNSADNKDNYKYFSVRKVVDGDTFWIDNGSEKGLKIRLIGVDAPESRNSGKKEIS